MNDLYRERAHLVALLAAIFPSVISYNDPKEPSWPVIYIDTVEGQLSWHICPDDMDLFKHVRVESDTNKIIWDGHTTEEKYARIVELIKSLG